MTKCNNLKTARKSKGLSVKSLSIKSGVSESSIYVYEKSGEIPNDETAAKIANAIGVDVDELADVCQEGPKRGSKLINKMLSDKEILTAELNQYLKKNNEVRQMINLIEGRIKYLDSLLYLV